MADSTFTFIDLFCGIGGFRIGLEALGGTCVFSCDSNKLCREIYKKNFHDAPKGDIRNVDITGIPDFDILTAGFPCQPFTKLGGQTGFSHKRGSIFEYIIEIAKAKRPKVLFLENVPSLLNTNKGECFKRVKEAIMAIGYSVHFEVINGKYLLPQNRNRLYIVCFQPGIIGASFEFPILPELKRSVRDIMMAHEEIADDYQFLIPTENQVQRRVDFRKQAGKKDGVTLNIDVPSPAIVSSYRKERTQKFVPCERNELGVRYLHYREVARLQGIPEDFQFFCKFAKRPDMFYKCLGNCVMPPVIAAIGCHILKELGLEMNLEKPVMSLLVKATSKKDAAKLHFERN